MTMIERNYISEAWKYAYICLCSSKLDCTLGIETKMDETPIYLQIGMIMQILTNQQCTKDLRRYHELGFKFMRLVDTVLD